MRAHESLLNRHTVSLTARAALMTGRLPIRNGIYTNSHFGRNSVFFPNVTGGLVEEEETIAEILAKLGYRNKIIGKW